MDHISPIIEGKMNATETKPAAVENKVRFQRRIIAFLTIVLVAGISHGAGTGRAVANTPAIEGEIGGGTNRCHQRKRTPVAHEISPAKCRQGKPYAIAASFVGGLQDCLQSPICAQNGNCSSKTLGVR